MNLSPNGWETTALRTLANNSVPGVGVSTPCGPVSSRGIMFFVPDSLELYITEGFLTRAW